MPRGIPKNGINKGWFKKGNSVSGETRNKISNTLKKKSNILSANMKSKWADPKYREKQTSKLMGYIFQLFTIQSGRNWFVFN